MRKIKNTVYRNKEFIINKLIAYLQKELNIEYFVYNITDIDGNIADILVKKDSKLFNENIEGKDYIKFNVEELIDYRMFENKDDIIILGVNDDEKLIDLDYMQSSLDYYYLSYSEKIKDKLSTFVNYVINKNSSD